LWSSWPRACVRQAPPRPAAATWSFRETMLDGSRRFSIGCWTTCPVHLTEIRHLRPRARAPGRSARVSPPRRRFLPGHSTCRWNLGLGAPRTQARYPGLVPSLPRCHRQHLTPSSAYAASSTPPDSSRNSHRSRSCAGAARSITGPARGPRLACSRQCQLSWAPFPFYRTLRTRR
jgi:hypothetical protein